MYLEHLFFFDSDSTVAEGLGRDISKILTYQIKTYRFIIYIRFMNTYLYRLANWTFCKNKLKVKKIKNQEKTLVIRGLNSSFRQL